MDNSLPKIHSSDSPDLQVLPEEIEWNGLSLQGPPFGLEHLADYGVGGHHPVHLDDVIGGDSCYRVMHKLGHGGFGTVWLCRDLKFDDASTSNKYCALKIMVADESNEEPQELQMHQKLKTLLNTPGNTEGAEFICLPFNQFSIQGPNGSHYCFAYPVLGPRVSSFNSSLFEEPDKLLRGLCRQTVQAMQFSHSHDICHGDFTPSNIPLTLFGLEDLSEEALLTLLGLPERVPIVDQSGLPPSDGTAPQYLVYPVDWEAAGPKFLQPSTTISVIDFGESYKVSNPPEDLGIPGPYKAPECILEKATGKACDLWALGCTLLEIRTGRKLFACYDDGDDDYLEFMTQILGKLPEPWWSTTWRRRREFYKDYVDENGRVLYIDARNRPPREMKGVVRTVHPAVAQGARSLSEKLRPGVWHFCGDSVHREIGEGEIGVFADLLGGLLRYVPGERMQVGEVLSHEWFKMTLPEPVTLRGR